MANNLDSSIQQIVARAASEIAQAVRVNIAEEVKKVVSLTGSTRSTPASTPASRGSNAKGPRAAAPKATGKKRRGVSEDEIKTVVDFIARNPGKRSEEIRKALNLSQEQGGKILAKLRELKRVRTKGEKRATTYSI